MYEKMEQLDGNARCEREKMEFLGEWNVQSTFIVQNC